MIKQRRNTIAILDIGSTKIFCLIAKISHLSELELLGEGRHASIGIKTGIVADLKSAMDSIIRTIEVAEKDAEVRIDKVYVSISSNNLLSHLVNIETNVIGHEINSKDINKTMFQALDRYKEQDVEVVHSFVVDYILDGNRGIISPLGMYGNVLGSSFHIISAPTNIIANLSNCLSKCQLEVESYIASSYAAGIACLTDDEMKYGVTLIDFGGGCTSMSIFTNGQLIHTDGIIMGGINITNDIARGLNISFDKAERIKNIHGTVIFTTDSKDDIELPSDDEGEADYISKALLVEIIRARVEEILEVLTLKLRESGYESYTNRIVITGGGAILNGLRELIGHIFSAKVRIGYPNKLPELPDTITQDTGLSTAVGMLMHIIRSKPELSQNKHENKSSLLQWIKEIFLN